MARRKLSTILRFAGLTLGVLGALVTLPAAVQAQTCNPASHGVSIFKECNSPKNRCGTDADCSDADVCNGLEQCATEEAPGSNVVQCTIRLANPTSHCDNVTLLDAADAILNGTGPGQSSDTILITGVSTGVVSGTCTAGTDLGGATTCTIGPGGSVSFDAHYYTTAATDPAALNDQATINVMDTCSAGGAGCSTTPNMVQFTASTSTVSGCTPGTPLICNDGNACTTDSCDPATGCATTPVACGDDGNLCNGPEACDPTTGQCASGPALVCNDGLFCTDDSCVPATGCTTTPHNCSDGLLCTSDTCDETTDGCVNTPVVCTPDSNLCTTEACNPNSGACESGPPTPCADDANLCNGPEACNPATGQCASGPPLVCNDGLFCTDDSCVPATGCTTTPHNCSDGVLCTTDTCNEAGDTCVNSPVVCTQDSNLCTIESCNPTTGACDSGAATPCGDDANVCNGPEACNPATGQCSSGPPLVCNDGLFCTDDSCVPATGCTTTAHNCVDTDECTIDSCNEDRNQCDHVLSTDPACNPISGRMTGGGSVFTPGGARATHGFELHCDVEVGPNNLEINWGGGNHFHLEDLVTATCSDDPNIAPPPPNADFDTYVGTGTGRCNGVDGATISFTLTDAGEPGKFDTASFEISGCPGGLTLSVSNTLKKGNHQAHK